MTAAQMHLAALAALYGPTPRERIDRLTEAADGMHGLLDRLRVEPTAGNAQFLAWHVAAMQREAAQLMDAIAAKEARE